MITNGDFFIRKVAYVEGLQHNLISVSKLVVGTGLKVSFDDEGSEIIRKEDESISLKVTVKKRNVSIESEPDTREAFHMIAYESSL